MTAVSTNVERLEMEGKRGGGVFTVAETLAVIIIIIIIVVVLRKCTSVKTETQFIE